MNMRRRFGAKQKFIVLVIFFQILFTFNPVYSYHLRPQDDDVVRFNSLTGYHTITDNNEDLEVRINADFTVEKEVLNYSHGFVLNFDPRKMAYSPNVTNIIYKISSDGTSIKEGILNEDGKDEAPFNITVQVNETDFGFHDYKDYDLFLSYELKEHVTKQGNLYVVGLTFPGMEGVADTMSNYLVLPSSLSIPYRFPEGVYSDRLIEYSPDGSVEPGPWRFHFNDSDKKIFWYYDYEESEKEKISLLAFGAFIGAFIGLFLSTLFEVFGQSRKTKIVLLALSALGFIVLIFLAWHYIYKM